jgi:mannose-6-phosphate isomerase-like protein (cupin superfamily)
MTETLITHYKDHVGSAEPRPYKTTLFENANLLMGLNCLEPGQFYEKEPHSDMERFYLILEGVGEIVLMTGEQTDTRALTPGVVAWIPLGMAHRVENNGSVRLTLLTGISKLG